MNANLSNTRDDRFRKTGSFLRLFDPIFIRFGIDEFERVSRRYFSVEFFVLSIFEEHRKPVARGKSKMVIAMSADLLRILELARIQWVLALRTLYENALCADLSLVVINDL